MKTDTQKPSRPKKKSITLRGTYHKYPNYGFVIPDERESFGGDFFINKKNNRDAEHGDIVIARVLEKSKGKKPEAKIIKIPSKEVSKPKTLQGVFVEHRDFGFLEVEGRSKGLFVHKTHKKGAINGDYVEAEIHNYQDKKEARIVKILENDQKIVTGTFVKKGDFGFVLRKKGSDIFVSASRSLGAKSGDEVEVAITGKSGKKQEGIVRKILK